MTLDDLEEALKEVLEEIIPGFSIEEDDNGQVIIRTKLRQTEDGELVDVEDDEEDPDFDPDFEPLEEDEESDEEV